MNECKNCGASHYNQDIFRNIKICIYCKTEYELKTKPTFLNISTDGGVFINGNLNVNDEFIGRDKIIINK